MSEISVQVGLLNDLSMLKQAGGNLSSGGNSLSNSDASETTKAFAERYLRLRQLIAEYNELLSGDIKEIEDYYNDINKLDNN